MTSVDRELRSALVSDGTLAAIIGSRLYWIQLIQNPTYPAGVFQCVSAVPIYAQNVPGGSQAHVGAARYQFTFWSQSTDADLELESIRQAVLGVLAKFSAYAIAGSPPTTTQAPNFLLARRDGVEPQTQPPLFKTMLDVRVWYQDQ